MNRSERLAAVHERAMERFDAIYGVEWPQRMQSLRDRRFVTVRGGQWEGEFAFGQQLDANGNVETDGNGNPIASSDARMEIPKIGRALRRVNSEYRQARKAVDFRPKGDSDNDADQLDGLYRADMIDSPGGGQAAPDNAFSEGTQGGYGGWRYRARYEDESDEENEHQRIGMEPIYDADISLFFDLDAKHQDKSDARHAFLLFSMSKDAFETKHPNAAADTFTTPVRWDYDWTRPDALTLAEYFEVEDHGVTRVKFRQEALVETDLEPEEATYDEDQLEDVGDDDLTLAARLDATGFVEVSRRKIKRQRVRKYLLSGVEVIADEGYIAGPNIPLVPYFAERSYIDGIERVSGAVRPAIDPQRVYNVIVSQLTNAAAGPAESLPIVTTEQISGHELTWAGRKVNRPAYLPINPQTDGEGNPIATGPVGMIEPTGVSQATAALLSLMSGDIDQLMGETDQPATVPANTSAQAIELVNDRADVRDFLWHDNFSIALQRGGQIYAGMAAELYVEPGRKMEIADEDGAKSNITLAEAFTDGGTQTRRNDFAGKTFDVVVDVGPASKTRRDATVKGLMGIASQAGTLAGVVPQAGQIALAALGTAITQYDGEGIDGTRAYVRKMGVTDGWIEPNEEEAEELRQAAEQPQPPDPNLLLAEAQMVAAQAEAKKAETGMIEAQAKVINAEATAMKAKAEAIKALASIEREDREQILREVNMELDNDRADEKLTLDKVEALRGEERHERDMAVPLMNNGEG